MELFWGCALGLLLGAQHALEPDHLAAVTTLLTEGRRGRPALLGAVWGLGHSVALLGVGLALALLRTQLPARISDLCELVVALMLVMLGIRALRQALLPASSGPARAHVHTHAHAHARSAEPVEVHAHGGPEAHFHLGRFTIASRPFLVGVVHGLAGSGSLTALALASLPTPALRLGYIALFGLGSVLGMATLTGLLGWPLAHLSRRGALPVALSSIAGAVSVGLGILSGWPIAGRLLGSG